MNRKTREMLSKAMTVHKKPGAGGRQFDYIKGEDVIARLNEAFEHDWSSKVISHWVTDDKIKQVLVLVEVTAGGASHQGFGGAEIAVYTSGHRQGEPVDTSNSMKGALTNALKNAAKQFGIGLVSDEVGSFSDFEEPSPKPAPVKPTVEASSVIKTKSDPAKSLASTFKEGSKGDSTPAFTPSMPKQENIMVNDVQIGAMKAMAKIQKIDPAEAISEALGGASKSEFKDLTTEEARKVISHLHSLKGA